MNKIKRLRMSQIEADSMVMSDNKTDVGIKIL